MAKTKGRSQDAKTPEAIISFSKDLFTAKTNDKGVKQYGCTLLFKKGTDLSGLVKLCLDACEQDWPGKAAGWLKDETIKSPFLDGDGKQGRSKSTGEPHKGYPGHTFIRCTSGEAFKPKVFDRQRNPVFDVESVPSGSKVFAVVNAYTWDTTEQGKGVSFGVSLVQVIEKATGDAILGGGGGPDPDKYFDAIADEGAAPKETKSGAGAGSLFG